MNKIIAWLICISCVASLVACATPHEPAQGAQEEEVQALQTSLWAQNSVQSSDVAPASATPTTSIWQHQRLPGKAATQFSYAFKDGRPSVSARSKASASMLRKSLRKEAHALGKLRFSWKVPALIAAADMRQRETEDSPVRVVLAFDGDRTKLSPGFSMLSELSHALTGEPLPYATLMYVWSNQPQAQGSSVIINPRTDRVRKLVLESGSAHLNQWLDYERDIRADYKKAFGEEPGALIGVGIMTDSDNTQSSANAWYGPLLWSAN